MSPTASPVSPRATPDSEIHVNSPAPSVITATLLPKAPQAIIEPLTTVLPTSVRPPKPSSEKCWATVPSVLS